MPMYTSPAPAPASRTRTRTTRLTHPPPVHENGPRGVLSRPQRPTYEIRRGLQPACGSRRRAQSDQESRSEPAVRPIPWSVTAAPTAITISEGDPHDRRHQDDHLPRHGRGEGEDHVQPAPRRRAVRGAAVLRRLQG